VLVCTWRTIYNEIMVENMVESTSSSINVHGVVDDNSNRYKSMVINAMRMNQGDAGKFSIADEEQNADTTRFFDLLKDYDKSLWDECINHNKLSSIEHVFTIKSDHELKKADYDRIVEWTRNILPKKNRLKENFYDEIP